MISVAASFLDTLTTARSKVYTIQRHECLQKQRRVHSEATDCRISVALSHLLIVLCIFTATRVTYFSTRGKEVE